MQRIVYGNKICCKQKNVQGDFNIMQRLVRVRMRLRVRMRARMRTKTLRAQMMVSAEDNYRESAFLNHLSFFVFCAMLSSFIKVN